MDLLTMNQLFMAIAAGVIPFLVAITQRAAGDALWPEINAPTIAVVWGAVLGILFWFGYPHLYPDAAVEATWPMYMISGGFAGLAAIGVHALGKDVVDRSITNHK